MSARLEHVESVPSELMADFAERTGLVGNVPPRRYLWTDAFAVANYIELYGRTGNAGVLDLALRLIDQVHNVLGRHRDDDPRTGWISGLSDEEARLHPTAGGLRIGKPLNERRPPAPVDPRLEWERDGQYLHYLTRWMRALRLAARATEEVKYLRWAMELAVVAHDAFAYVPRRGDSKRLYWKMSVDLTYPLVPSMGQLDPLECLITLTELQAAAAETDETEKLPDLSKQIADLSLILADVRSLVTDDPLGIGGLLTETHRLARLLAAEHSTRVDVLLDVLQAANLSLRSFSRVPDPQLEYRLPFRDLGLAIGLAYAEDLADLIDERGGALPDSPTLRAHVEGLSAHFPRREEIVSAWIEASQRESSNWQAHRDINEVMLATAILADRDR